MHSMRTMCLFKVSERYFPCIYESLTGFGGCFGVFLPCLGFGLFIFFSWPSQTFVKLFISCHK